MKLTVRDLGLMKTEVFTVKDADVDLVQRYLELRKIPYRKSRMNRLCIDNEIGKQIITNGYDYQEEDLDEIINGVDDWGWGIFGIEGRGWHVIDPTLPDIIDDYLERRLEVSVGKKFKLIPGDCSYSFVVMIEDSDVIFKYLKDNSIFYYTSKEAYKLLLMKQFSEYYHRFGCKYLSDFDVTEIVKMINFSGEDKNPIIAVTGVALDYYVKLPKCEGRK